MSSLCYTLLILYQYDVISIYTVNVVNIINPSLACVPQNLFLHNKKSISIRITIFDKMGHKTLSQINKDSVCIKIIITT